MKETFKIGDEVLFHKLIPAYEDEEYCEYTGKYYNELIGLRGEILFVCSHSREALVRFVAGGYSEVDASIPFDCLMLVSEITAQKEQGD